MNRNNFVQTPSDEAKTAVDGTQTVSTTNATTTKSPETPSPLSSNSSTLQQCDDQSEDILNGIKVLQKNTLLSF